MKRAITMAIVLMTVLSAGIFDPRIASAASVPTRVKNVRASEITCDAITLKWDQAKNIKYYQIYRVVKMYKAQGKTKYKYRKVGNTYKTKCTVKRLKAGKRYRFRIRAVNENGRGRLSKVKDVKTMKPATSSYSVKREMRSVSLRRVQAIKEGY